MSEVRGADPLFLRVIFSSFWSPMPEPDFRAKLQIDCSLFRMRYFPVDVSIEDATSSIFPDSTIAVTILVSRTSHHHRQVISDVGFARIILPQSSVATVFVTLASTTTMRPSIYPSKLLFGSFDRVDAGVLCGVLFGVMTRGAFFEKISLLFQMHCMPEDFSFFT